MSFMGDPAMHNEKYEGHHMFGIRYASNAFVHLRTLLLNNSAPWGPLGFSIALCGFAALLLLVPRRKPGIEVTRRRLRRIIESSSSAEATDPPLMAKYSEFRRFETSVATYPAIRVFYRPHPQADKIPNEPEPLPLLVFIHGLGGCFAQFNSVLPSLVDVAPCLGIDLPGCGRSKFAPKDWKAYETGALVSLLDTIIEEYRMAQDGQENRGVVLICHSMGCSLAASLASHRSPYASRVRSHVRGLVAICPKAEPPTVEEVKSFRKFLSVPDPLFNLFRLWDRRGGTDSASVRRYVGAGAGIDVRKLQLRFNRQSKTPVWRRMAWGALPVLEENIKHVAGLPGLEVWKGLQIPVCLIAGEADRVTKAEEVEIIKSAMNNQEPRSRTVNDEPLPDASKISDAKTPMNDPAQSSDEKYGLKPIQSELREAKQAPVVKSAILPSPAAHGLLYDHATYRTVAGLIADFLSEDICKHLSLGWQLSHLTTSGKWDVKNLKKWQGVAPVSGPIGPVDEPVFRALKTLRKQDKIHTPSQFVKDWKDKIYAIIDISHDSPTYDPAELEAGGIEYHKFPTVSKIPPTVHEVQDFIALVERLRAEIYQLPQETTGHELEAPARPGRPLPVIGVHCHYGYNRTGFFIVCYLVEKSGYQLEAALQEFEHQRPPGIRHDHFIDTLYVRYTIGLRKPDESTKTMSS